MQWLIDIIKEWIVAEGYALQSWVQAQGYLTASFVWRGTHGLGDFSIADFQPYETWQELDLSAIVPDGAKAVLLLISAKANVVDALIEVKHPDQTAVLFIDLLRTQVANQTFSYLFPAPISSDRKVKFWAENVAWVAIALTVKGWWL